MSLKEIFCQDKAVSTLQKAFASGRIAHAYIFAGMDGIGKFKTAYEFARLMLCENPVKDNDFFDSCGNCRSCLAFDAGSHPDFSHIYKELLEFTKDGKDKTTPIDLSIHVVREFLIDKVSIKPVLSERKIYIVSETEKLNINSQNACLKVLEEPAPYCCIISLCSRPDKLLPTIKSRCQTIRFGPVSEEKITERLLQEGLAEEIAKFFARLSLGSIGTAINWARLESQGAQIFETKKELIKILSNLQYDQALTAAEQFLTMGKQITETWSKLDEQISKKDINRRAQKTIIQIVISALSDTIRLSVTPGEPLINFDQEQQIRKIADKFSPEQAGVKIADAYRSIQWLDSNVNEKLIFEQLLLNLAVSDKIAVS